MWRQDSEGSGWGSVPQCADDGLMAEIARKLPTDLKPLDPRLTAEVLDWANALRTIWYEAGLSVSRFARLQRVINKGTVWRYLHGDRVPRDSWFLDRVLATSAENGKPVTPAVRDHLMDLQLRALEVRHPHEYRVRLVSDELEIAQTGRQEAERFARALEKELAERNRQVRQLGDDKGRLRAGWDADRSAMHAEYDRLTREIGEITGQLNLAWERAVQAERRCLQLEHMLDRLDAHPAADQDPAVGLLATRGEFERAQLTVARSTEFGWITRVGPGFQISAPSQTVCRLLDLRYEDLDGSYLLADPLRGRLQELLGNFGEWALMIGMLTQNAMDSWRSDPGYPGCAAKVTGFFDWLSQYVTENYLDVADQVESAPAVLVDGDSSRNDLRQCLAAAAGDAPWPPYNFSRHNTLRVHVMHHRLLTEEAARFAKVARPFYAGNKVIGYEVTWTPEGADPVANQLMNSVLAELGIISDQ
jgi:hypothetical protein